LDVLHVVLASVMERRRSDYLKAVIQAVSYSFTAIGCRILCWQGDVRAGRVGDGGKRATFCQSQLSIR
jgi:hypothetical protein